MVSTKSSGMVGAVVTLTMALGGCEGSPETDPAVEALMGDWIAPSSISPACSDFIFFSETSYARGIVCAPASGDLISVEAGAYTVTDATVTLAPAAATCDDTDTRPSQVGFTASETGVEIVGGGKTVSYVRNNVTADDLSRSTLGCIRIPPWTFTDAPFAALSAPTDDPDRRGVALRAGGRADRANSMLADVKK